MKIKTIHLNKYKRFFDLKIDLGDNPKRIIALVGPNGCGKSSVFDGMLFLQRAHEQIGENFNGKEYKYHSLEQNPSYGYKNIQIEFDKGEYRAARKCLVDEGKSNTLFSFRSSFRFNSNLNVREAKAVSELRKNDYGASFANDIDQRIEQNYRRLQIKYNKYLNEQDCRPSEAKTHIIGELNSAIQKCLNLNIESLGDIQAGQGTFYFRKPDSDKIFEYDVLSAGEKEVVDILLDLYLRKEEYVDSIYIINEPELHLNTAIQRKLLIEINKLIPENCQIWIATHSIGFLRALQEELNDISQIIEFKEENKWASEEYVLTPMVKSRNNWKRIFSTALEDLVGLIAPKRIIYCEGKAEPNNAGCERGLDAEIYNIIFGEAYPETLFVSSGGNTELDQRSDIAIRILSKVFSDIEIWVLKDRDMASGKETSEKDREIYLKTNPNNHRILNRFELENYLYDKEVLKHFCNTIGKEFKEKEYDSFVTDIVNQHVKDETGRIKNYCNIVGSISVENFKKNLSHYILPDMKVYKELEEVIFKEIDNII